jgi:hypothetical protein
MIKKHDDQVVEGFDIEEFEDSVLTGRNLAEVAGDSGAAEWKSGPTGRGKLKAAWLADAVAKLDKKRAAESVQKKNHGKSQETQPTRSKNIRRNAKKKK